MEDNNLNLEMPDEIKLLKFPMCVRDRIGMYLGGTDSTDNLLREIIDNSLDECQHTANYVIIDRNFNGFQFVADNGRGLPITYSRELKDGERITQADLSISTLHSGSKFSDNKSATIGMNGVGSAAVNAVSEDYIILSKITQLNFDKSIPEVKALWDKSGPRSKKDLFYVVWYKKGFKHFEGAYKKSDAEKFIFKDNFVEFPEGMSTMVLFKPDPEIFSKEAMNTSIPIQNLQYFLLIQEKFFQKPIKIWVEGTIMTSSGFTGFGFEFMKRIVPEDTSLNEYVDVFVSVGVDPELKEKVSCGSVNSLTVDSGVHLTYVEDCFAKALKEEFKIKHRFLTTGLKLCVVALASEVTFASQTKEKLKAFTKVKPSDFAPLQKEFIKLFRKNPDYWQEHVRKLDFLAESMKSLGASEKAQKIIDDASGRNLYRSKSDMVGLADATASPNDRWNCELFICEGLSTLGALSTARKSTKYHAVLPLRGKVLNVKDSTADQVMNNKEFFTIFKVIGLGIDVNNVTKNANTPEEAYNLIQKYTRYGKIIIATDADQDGLAIQNGILYALQKFARFLIDFGLVYIVESPIFEQNGTYYYPSDPDIEGTVFKQGMIPSKHYRRFKGLGSLDQEDIYDVFYDPSKRRIFQVTMNGSDYSMQLVEDINARKKLLYDNGVLSNPYNFNDIVF